MWRRLSISLVLAMLSSTGCALIVEDHDDEDPERNRAPDVSVTVEPVHPKIGEEVTLDASGSTDPEADSLRFRFEVRDSRGETIHRSEGYESRVSFRARRGGTYRVEVVGIDEHGAKRSVATTVKPKNRAPEVEMYWELFLDGDRVSFGSGAGGVDAASAPFDRLAMELERVRDPEGHRTEIRWELESTPSGYSAGCTPCGTMQYGLPMTEPGTYRGRVVVRDAYGATTTLPFYVRRSR